MDKINIENLFHCKTHINTKILDVRAITNNQKIFNTDTLIETREKKRKTLLNYYLKFYDICLKKIEIANNLNKTDLLYTVTEFIPNCPEYKPIDCIEYIKEKLENNFFDTYIVGNKTLFITWLYLEANKEKLNPIVNINIIDKSKNNNHYNEIDLNHYSHL
jgi:hypothetical protein